ncbi:MAG: hypothetical protein WDK96_01725 [Candidatus Paceibacterota bacterium]|jgi:DNA-binding transcriptional regulator PaaX
MSIKEEILKEFSSPRFRYKGVSTNIFGIPKFSGYSKRTIRTTVDRLIKQEMIKKELNSFILTPDGKKYLKKKENSLKSFPNVFSNNAPKNLLVVFDLPVDKKAEREWFRFHLKKFNYMLIQQSVWVGPSPLPKEFLQYLEEIELKKCIKIFKLGKPY